VRWRGLTDIYLYLYLHLLTFETISSAVARRWLRGTPLKNGVYVETHQFVYKTPSREEYNTRNSRPESPFNSAHTHTHIYIYVHPLTLETISSAVARRWLRGTPLSEA